MHEQEKTLHLHSLLVPSTSTNELMKKVCAVGIITFLNQPEQTMKDIYKICINQTLKRRKSV